MGKRGIVYAERKKIPVRDFPTGKTEAGILDNATKESI
jgi:hypothetical protein